MKKGPITLTGKMLLAYFKKHKEEFKDHNVDITSSYPVHLLGNFETMDEKLKRRRPLRKETI